MVSFGFSENCKNVSWSSQHVDETIFDHLGDFRHQNSLPTWFFFMRWWFYYNKDEREIPYMMMLEDIVGINSRNPCVKFELFIYLPFAVVTSRRKKYRFCVLFSLSQKCLVCSFHSETFPIPTFTSIIFCWCWHKNWIKLSRLFLVSTITASFVLQQYV